MTELLISICKSLALLSSIAETKQQNKSKETVEIGSLCALLLRLKTQFFQRGLWH